MALVYRKNLVAFNQVVGVEEAESLLEWLQKKSSVRVDFSACEHVHPANLQALLAAGVSVDAWPENATLSQWLKSLFVQT